jgi:hypothetical protein
MTARVIAKIMLVNYASVDMVLHAFDLDACRVAYVLGRRTQVHFVATRGFIRAVATGIMVVGPWTLKARVNKYRERGFEAAFPQAAGDLGRPAEFMHWFGQGGSGGRRIGTVCRTTPIVRIVLQTIIRAITWYNSRPGGTWRWMAVGNIRWPMD